MLKKLCTRNIAGKVIENFTIDVNIFPNFVYFI